MSSDYTSYLYAGSPDEVQALRAICREWMKTEGFWDFDSMLAFLQKPFARIRYLKDEGADTWSAAIVFQAVMDQADLIYVYVSPRVRRQSLGQKLFDDMLRQLSMETKVEQLLLEVKESNTAARRFYERNAMQNIRTIKRYYKNLEDALVYHKAISRA